MTIGELHDRLVEIGASNGYTQAKTPFDFDVQPSQNLDQTFCLSVERIETTGLIGGDQIEVHRVTFFLAQKVKAQGWGAQRSLLVDTSLVEQALVGDFPDFDYHVQDDSVRSDVKSPSAGDDYAVARLQVDVEIDRIMN